MNSKLKATVLVTIGFLLSPLSWWNDIIINIPLAYIFSFPFSLISRNLFLPSFILGYFLTNVLGFILMHKGVDTFTDKKTNKNKELIKDVLISLIYVAIILILVLTGVLKAPTEYLGIK